MVCIRFIMIATKLLNILLLLLHQIASFRYDSAVQAGHPLYSATAAAAAADDDDGIFDKALWPDNQELPLKHRKAHHHRHPKWDTGADEQEESRASSRQQMSIIDDPLDHDNRGNSFRQRAPSGGSKLSETRPATGRFWPQETRIRHRHLTSSAEQQQQQQQHHGGTYVATSKDRFWHNNRFHQTDWCSRDCELADYISNNSSSALHHANRSICASDGRLYKSMCELKRHSCRHNVRLRRRPETFCPAEQDSHTTTATNLIAANSATSRDSVRIVELKKLCDTEEYNRMKRLMFDEFNGNVRSMFRYYDVDADNYVEAHELWPSEQSNGNGGKLIYAQVWDNHTTKCPHNNQDSGHGDHSKCWYFLDFAFQPQYPKNPCSLSHLMLFDLNHPNHKFDYGNFADAFSNFTLNSSSIAERNYNNGTSIVEEKNRLIKRRSEIIIGLGDNIDLKCRGNLLGSSTGNSNNEKNRVIKDVDDEYLLPPSSSSSSLDVNNQASSRCTWTRYNSNLAASKDAHISISEQRREKGREKGERNEASELLLHITEAQLYLSGQFKCICHFKELALNFEHSYHLQVLAKPRVKILPHYQWSLPKSRISFECQYDQISTSSDSSDRRLYDDDKSYQRNSPVSSATSTVVENQDKLKSQFGLAVEWFQGKENLNAKQSRLKPSTHEQSEKVDLLVDQLFEFSTGAKDESSSFEEDDEEEISDETLLDTDRVCNTSARVSITTSNSRLTLGNVQPCDSGPYTCRVGLPQRSSLNPTVPIVGQDTGRLLVQDKLKTDEGLVQPQSTDYADNNNNQEREISQLWILHENGISVYKIQDDDSQEMELLREINGHSSISAQVEDNWNQLTLCGGLNSEQAVICEWSDNAVFINVDHHSNNNNNNNNDHNDGEQQQIVRGNESRKYVYVGQPNLNRVVVFDSLKFEIVAIINTEPQPRRLHLYQPNKIHLSKWVKRRLTPIGNVRWESAIGTKAHLPESTPQESRLYSSLSSSILVGGPDHRTSTTNSNVNKTIGGSGERAKRAVSVRSNSAEPSLIQHDIWLLCYGQPLVPLDPSSSGGHYHRKQELGADEQSVDSSSSNGPRLNESRSQTAIRQSQTDSIKPFEPRLSTGAGGGGIVFAPFAWPSNIWPPSGSGSNSGVTNTGNNNNNNNDNDNDNININMNNEARIRNRKSVHIIQSTFLPSSSRLTNDGSVHRHSGDSEQDASNFTAVDEFKRTSVISTHHIYPGSGSSRSTTTNHFHFGAAGPSPSSSSSPLQRISLLAAAGRRPRYDLIQDLFVPQRPYSMERRPEFKIHYAYVTHYDGRRLFRISMDNYRYDQEIDLQDCDPIHMLATAQGLVVVQCRAPISHSLIGQLVLDQLASSRIEFNANIRAQESYLSPDNRYLVSIFHNTLSSAAVADTAPENTGKGQGHEKSFSLEKSHANNTGTAGSSSLSEDDERHQYQESASGQAAQRHSSIVYVQTVTLDGLRLQYEIKTLFEISQCSFVWKDGYYAAIFVTTNRKDQQSEILSLRLIDSRLELMARVPGLVSATRHKEQFIVSPELRLAALTTNQGTFVIDLEENRVSQSLRPRHLSPPTLLWV